LLHRAIVFLLFSGIQDLARHEGDILNCPSICYSGKRGGEEGRECKRVSWLFGREEVWEKI